MPHPYSRLPQPAVGAAFRRPVQAPPIEPVGRDDLGAPRAGTFDWTKG